MNDLDRRLLAHWRGLCAATELFANPFYAPAFAQAVSACRRDVRVAVVKRQGAPVAFWAFHVRPGGLLRPVGAPICDWEGPVCAPGEAIDLAQLVRDCGGQLARFNHLGSPSQDLASPTPDQGAVPKANSWLIDLSAGVAAYRGRLSEARAKHVANVARSIRKFERELGPLHFAYQDPTREALDTLLMWKRRQMRETGAYDIFAAAWIRQLFDVLWRWPEPDFGLVFATVRHDDRLVAGEVYLRAANRLHAWIPSFDRAFGAYSPGHVLTDRMVDAAGAANMQTIDFGAGNDDYKSKWCLDAQPVGAALVYAAGQRGAARQALARAWGRASGVLGPANPLLSRARGLCDHVFAAHGAWWAGSVGFAAAALSRRGGD